MPPHARGGRAAAAPGARGEAEGEAILPREIGAQVIGEVGAIGVDGDAFGASLVLVQVEVVVEDVALSVAEDIVGMHGWSEGATISNGGKRWDATKRGQQLGYLNANTVGIVNFAILIAIGWAFAHKEQVARLRDRVLRRNRRQRA